MSLRIRRGGGVDRNVLIEGLKSLFGRRTLSSFGAVKCGDECKVFPGSYSYRLAKMPAQVNLEGCLVPVRGLRSWTSCASGAECVISSVNIDRKLPGSLSSERSVTCLEGCHELDMACRKDEVSYPACDSITSEACSTETEILETISCRLGTSSGLDSLEGEKVVANVRVGGADGGNGTRNDNLSKRLKIESPSYPIPGREVCQSHTVAAWEHWKRLGEPKLHVAPMVDQSELPFRLLCRKYGATAGYTPMLHSRLFVQDPKYRKEFTTCPDDRPLFVQFCANNPDTLLAAAKLVEPCCDYVDINLGCPQRIAKRGNYGAFLMDNLPLIYSLVSNLASNLEVPVSCKIRLFPSIEDTLAYAHMLEDAGCSLLAVHGRTRDQKDGRKIRADWDAIKAIKQELKIPVLANGNIRWLEDVQSCMDATGVQGVMSAESLLENPALFSGLRMTVNCEDAASDSGSHNVLNLKKQPGAFSRQVNELTLLLEYLDLCEEYPVPMRMVRGHVHKMLGNFWFKQHPDLREELNKQFKLTTEWLKDMVHRIMDRPPYRNILLPASA